MTLSKQALVRDRERLERYKANFAKSFSLHEGDTDPAYLKAKQDIIDHLKEWEARLSAQERAYKAQQGRGR